MKIFFILLAMALLFLSMSCSSVKDGNKKPESDLQIFEKANKLYEQEDFEEAITNYEKLQTTYPTSKFVPDAELKIATAFFKRKKYIEAAENFKNFIKLHPTNPNIPYVLFHIGESYYFIAPSEIDRDLSDLDNSLKYFFQLTETYKEDEYAIKALPRINEIKIKQAGRILYIGDFYYKQKHFMAAMNRFKEVYTLYSGLIPESEALYKMGLCYFKLKDREGLLTVLNLIKEKKFTYPDLENLELKLNELKNN